MFVVKENRKFGTAFLTYTAAGYAAECFFNLTGERAEDDVALLNDTLEERYGIVLIENKTSPVYEITELTAGEWHCNKCRSAIIQGADSIENHSFFTVTNKDGDHMGNFFRQDVDDIVQTMSLLDQGGCPVCDGWQDGLGNTCSPNGWGKTLYFFRDCIHITK